MLLLVAGCASVNDLMINISASYNVYKVPEEDSLIGLLVSLNDMWGKGQMLHSFKKLILDFFQISGQISVACQCIPKETKKLF